MNMLDLDLAYVLYMYIKFAIELDRYRHHDHDYDHTEPGPIDHEFAVNSNINSQRIRPRCWRLTIAMNFNLGS